MHSRINQVCEAFAGIISMCINLIKRQKSIVIKIK